MGDRAVFVIKSGEDYADASVYIHWGGEGAVELLKAALPRLRQEDPNYSLARLIGELHNQISGNISLRVLPPPSPADFADDFAEYTHGDAGVLIYDCGTGNLQIHAGYLARQPYPANIGVPPGTTFGVVLKDGTAV